MKVLICGTREEPTPVLEGVIRWRLRFFDPDDLLIHGGCSGVDELAARIWYASSRPAPKVFPAEWRKYGQRAGPLRNAEMLREGKPDLVIAFHHDPDLGKGTADMVRRARYFKVPVEIHVVPRGR